MATLCFLLLLRTVFVCTSCSPENGPPSRMKKLSCDRAASAPLIQSLSTGDFPPRGWIYSTPAKKIEQDSSVGNNNKK